MIKSYTFDGQNGLMTNQTVTQGATTLLNLSYYYNRGQSKGTLNGKTGNLTHIVNNLDRNKDRVYEHDALGRLIKAKGGAATGFVSVTANWTQDYSYDRYGNKLTTVKNGVTQDSQLIPYDGLPSLSYDNSSNRINTSGYQYDKAGNLVKGEAPDGSWQRYEYDAAGRLVYVRRDSDGWIQQANEYAATRERLASWSYASADIIYYVWGGQNVIGEYTTQYGSSSLTWRKNYVYAGSRLLSTQTNNGAGGEIQEFHHPDRLGTKLITNGILQYEQSTLPFGTFLGAESTGATNQVFTSYDRSTSAKSMDYAVNRSYTSGQSRFTQVDPIGMSAAALGNPQSNNLYAYVQNQPIDFVDPSGLLMVIMRCEPDRYRIEENGVVTILAGQCYIEVIGGDSPGTIITPRGPGGIEDGGGVGPGGPGNTPGSQSGSCGVNPVTKKPGVTLKESGKSGEIRPGKGGKGGFKASRKNKVGYHTGLDIAGNYGDPVYAALGGTVKSITGSVKDTKGYGLMVVIQHENGLTTRYAHLSGTGVKVDDPIDEGVEVGKLGTSGNAISFKGTAEEHVHFEVRGKNGLINPADFLNSPCPK